MSATDEPKPPTCSCGTTMVALEAAQAWYYARCLKCGDTLEGGDVPTWARPFVDKSAAAAAELCVSAEQARRDCQ